MSPRSSKPSSEPPKADVYVGMLFVAVAALTTGCIFLVLELYKYNWAVP